MAVFAGGNFFSPSPPPLYPLTFGCVAAVWQWVAVGAVGWLAVAVPPLLYLPLLARGFLFVPDFSAGPGWLACLAGLAVAGVVVELAWSAALVPVKNVL